MSTTSMEDSLFWEKIAKYLSGNCSDEEKADIESLISQNGNSVIFRDASLLYGKSSQEIKKRFKNLEQQLKK